MSKKEIIKFNFATFLKTFELNGNCVHLMVENCGRNDTTVKVSILIFPWACHYAVSNEHVVIQTGVIQ